ncbi:winged helix-turn-helix transcriptional regulator [Pseudomonas entomophila]|uniref:ArsR/SmtB family transcription factor n=1 Tax=Pseudomonas entomophila TaxID=312306 RepID=UPI0015E3A7DE|nr:metalloregulator ArsR/SmtB family transcription factor [Pseudomonas entomophila]MBA1192431.1 winged helix-turn-helix transcriptional regulator [Pseudomonas entomophila]
MRELDPSQLSALMARSEDLAELFRVMANPTRLTLLCHIAKGECAVAELERALGLRQPGLSQQLGELRQKGLLKSRRESRSIFYAIADPRILPVLGALYDTTLAPKAPAPTVNRSTVDTPRIAPSPATGERATFARIVRDLG